ncbi:MAG: hypothetical protein WC381_07625 [Kiritimatiellia bacterium]|jgi:hypothetical protein
MPYTPETAAKNKMLQNDKKRLQERNAAFMVAAVRGNLRGLLLKIDPPRLVRLRRWPNRVPTAYRAVGRENTFWTLRS